MNVFDRLISIVAPYDCIHCGCEGSLLCRDCAWLLGEITPERCFRCYEFSPENKTCKKCRRTSNLAHVWIRTEYKDEAKELVHAMKFERSAYNAEVIARFMKDVIPSNISDIVVVPVPTATSRRRQRGYDQAIIIARKLSALTSLPFACPVARIGQSRQVGSKKADRLKQLHGSFIITNNNCISGKRVLLVDDVLTTGATLEAVAKVLRDAGAKQVDAVVFARA